MYEFKQTNQKEKGITLIALIVIIVVLLILASITIGALTSENGIINNAKEAKEKTEIANEKEIVDRATIQAMGNNSRGNLVEDELQEQLDKITGNGKTETNQVLEEIEVLFKESERQYIVDSDGNVSLIEQVENTAETPIYWEKTTKTDEEWYCYADITNGNEETNVNKPKLRGAMTAIKYVGEDAEEQTGSKWANAITADGSMWVWIPRYAYKITSGYHTNSENGGTIEVAFIDINNNFLNGETGTIVTEPSQVTYTDDGTGNQVQNEWLVHPAFTSNAENGGGFGELSGIWVGKFETTGSYDSSTETGTLSVKPATLSLKGMKINQQYKCAQTGTYGETVTLNSHMAKNSEWGAVAYLGQSKYGVNGQEVQKNTSAQYFTGGSNIESIIYETNKTQSTTYNSYGVYDLSGGASEGVAAYVNYPDNGHLLGNGGSEVGDLYGANDIERSTSTAYKTVYEASGGNELLSYNLTEYRKGDAIWETSNSNNNSNGSWFGSRASFPGRSLPFFMLGGIYGDGNAGVFYFGVHNGIATSGRTFRLILAF